MKLRPNKFGIAVIVAVIMYVLGTIGLDIPRDTVESQIEDLFQEEEIATGTVIEKTAKVKAVIDGDTFKLEDGTTVRILGIDTPEVEGSPAGAECYGVEASIKAKELLQNQIVTVQSDPTQDTYDKYERLLGYVRLPDGSDVGELLLRAGVAREYTYAAKYSNQQLYRNAEQAAKDSKMGLWGICK